LCGCAPFGRFCGLEIHWVHPSSSAKIFFGSKNWRYECTSRITDCRIENVTIQTKGGVLIYLINAFRKKIGRVKKIIWYMMRWITFASLDRRIGENKHAGKPPIAVLAPMYKRNEKDGYFQRVKSIDQNVLCGFYRVYLLNKGPKAKKMYAFCVDEEHAEVFFNGADLAQQEKVEAIIDKCEGLYAHSVSRLIGAKGEPLPFFAKAKIFKILDVHGAVPEEFLLYGQEKMHAAAEKMEAYAYAHADVIITLNQAMKAHLQVKHGLTQALLLNIPYFSSNEGKEKQTFPIVEGEKPRAVYAGGMQTWQNVEQIRELVKKTHPMYAYRLFVPDPKQLKKQWAPHLPVKEILIDTIPPHRIREAYAGCHYGLLLRDDIPVNNVACPAKLIEYLQNGIVPVLISDRIGDFADLGMQYVSCEDFAEGRIPPEEKRVRMTECNWQVLEKMEEELRAGCMEIRRMLATKSS